MNERKILLITTSQATMGSNSDEPTGVWFDELSAPYYAFVDAGARVTVASIMGGRVPIDPRSESAEGEEEVSVRRFKSDPVAMHALNNALPIDTIVIDDYDAVFLPGGHGTMWDLPNNPRLAEIIRETLDAQRPVAAVCHGPAGLIGVTNADGESIVAGKQVSAFTNSEEAAVGLADAVPFFLEDALRNAGAKLVTGPDFEPHVIRDGGLITGQNPASAAPAAQAVIEYLRAN